MKIGFFTEGGYTGKIDRNNPNMRTDTAWICSLKATHHPILDIQTLPDNLYDIGILILPKNKQHIMNIPLLSEYKRVCKKTTVMQESYYNYWQDSPIIEQIWYFNFIVDMDLIFCHNDIDLKYYHGLTGVRTELLPSLMITDNLIYDKTIQRSGVILGGNWTKDYGGFDSYQVASEITNEISAITTGRIKQEEHQLFNHIPWKMWLDWMKTLSQFKIGVQLGTAAAGTFNLNCSFWGIPCISYSTLNTQRLLHPSTTVLPGDIVSAKKIILRLENDKDFYMKCSNETRQLYKEIYSESAFLNKVNPILKSLLQ